MIEVGTVSEESGDNVENMRTNERANDGEKRVYILKKVREEKGGEVEYMACFVTLIEKSGEQNRALPFKPQRVFLHTIGNQWPAAWLVPGCEERPQQKHPFWPSPSTV